MLPKNKNKNIYGKKEYGIIDNTITIEQLENRFKCDEPRCTVPRVTDKIIDYDGKKYHSFTCREKHSTNYNKDQQIEF